MTESQIVNRRLSQGKAKGELGKPAEFCYVFCGAGLDFLPREHVGQHP